jgi:HEAT repeat protein
MRSLLFVIILFCVGMASAQTPANDFLDSLGIARLKKFSAARVSSDNRYVFSNDDSKHIMPGQTLVMADLAGPGAVTHIWLTVADNEFGWPRLLRLRAYYDGKKTPSVDAPLGDFFGVGHGMERDLNSIMVEDTSLGRARNSFWPMPYQKSCIITVTNEGNRPVRSFYYHVDFQKWPAWRNDLAYFHAYYRQERPATPGRNYEFLNIRGTGHYIGTVLNVIETGVGWFGEGDDLFYVDGAKHPQIYGTGAEDYFSEGWGLRDFTGPWSGSPISGGELPGQRLGAYRWHVPDPIPFTKSIWAGIEHAGWTYKADGTVRSGFEERADYYSSVAFWYQKGVNEDLPEPPYGEERLPLGNATQLAVEDSIQDVTTDNGKATVQREVDWSKDLLFFQAQGKGARINVPIDIAEAGRYELVALLAKGPDYGDYTALLDDEPANLDKRQPAASEVPAPGPEVFHNFLSEVYVAQDRPLGWFSLTRGRHALSFVCTGKDERSAGYNLGINDVVLEKVPESAGEPEAETIPRLTPEPPSVAPSAPAGVAVYRGRPLAGYRDKLKQADPDGRAAAIRSIGAFGEDAAPAAGELSAALGDPEVQVRAAAAWALSQIGRKGAAAAVPALGKALADSDPRVRDLAALALKAMGPAAAPAVPELIAALRDPVAYVRSPVADALGAIGPAARSAVVPMAERLLAKDEQGLVLSSIATALGDIGPEAKDAIPALQQAIAMHRISAAGQEAILRIEGKPVPTWW